MSVHIVQVCTYWENIRVRNRRDVQMNQVYVMVQIIVMYNYNWHAVYSSVGVFEALQWVTLGHTRPHWATMEQMGSHLV